MDGCGQKWMWPVWLQDSKIDLSQECTDGVSRFFNASANSGKLKVASMILGGHGQKWA